VVAASIALVLSPIRQLPSVRRVELVGKSSPEKTTLLIETTEDGVFQHALFRLLSGLSAPILELSPLGDTLEELFLRVSSDQMPKEGP